MNGSWLDVLDLLCSAHPCHHVGSSNLADNPSITLLTMRYVLILNRGDWSVFVYELCFCVDNTWRLETLLLSCHQLIVAAWFRWPSHWLVAIDLSWHQLIGAALFWRPLIQPLSCCSIALLALLILFSFPSVRRLEFLYLLGCSFRWFHFMFVLVAISLGKLGYLLDC